MSALNNPGIKCAQISESLEIDTVVKSAIFCLLQKWEAGGRVLISPLLTFRPVKTGWNGMEANSVLFEACVRSLNLSTFAVYFQ